MNKGVQTLLLFCVLPGLVDAQSATAIDSLGKYSYCIWGSTFFNKSFDRKTTAYTMEGSGFFLKADTSMFFITAKHVMAGYNPYATESEYPDSMSIVVKHCRTSIKISTSSTRGTYNPAQFENNPDIIAVPIADSMRYCVNSLEDFTLSPIPDTSNTLVIKGYPWNKIAVNGVFDVRDPHPSTLISHSFTFLDNDYDSIKYRIKIDDSPVDSSLGGYSGSPIFIANPSPDRFVLLGMFVSGAPGEGLLYVVKLKYVLQSIKKLD